MSVHSVFAFVNFPISFVSLLVFFCHRFHYLRLLFLYFAGFPLPLDYFPLFWYIFSSSLLCELDLLFFAVITDRLLPYLFFASLFHSPWQDGNYLFLFITYSYLSLTTLLVDISILFGIKAEYTVPSKPLLSFFVLSQSPPMGFFVGIMTIGLLIGVEWSDLVAYAQACFDLCFTLLFTSGIILPVSLVFPLLTMTLYVSFFLLYFLSHLHCFIMCYRGWVASPSHQNKLLSHLLSVGQCFPPQSTQCGYIVTLTCRMVLSSPCARFFLSLALFLSVIIPLPSVASYWGRDVQIYYFPMSFRQLSKGRGDFVRLNFNMYLWVAISFPSTLLFIRSTFVTPCSFRCSNISSSVLFLIVSL